MARLPCQDLRINGGATSASSDRATRSRSGCIANCGCDSFTSITDKTRLSIGKRRSRPCCILPSDRFTSRGPIRVEQEASKVQATAAKARVFKIGRAAVAVMADFLTSSTKCVYLTHRPAATQTAPTLTWAPFLFPYLFPIYSLLTHK